MIMVDKGTGVRVYVPVRHGQESRLGVIDGEIFVLKGGPEDTLPTGTIPLGEVSALQHKFGNDAVEG